MNELPAGYWQAVQNFAWETINLSEETISPIYVNNSEFEELDDVVDLINAQMSEKEDQLWAYLDEILEVIVETYNVERDVVWEHITIQMHAYENDTGPLV